MKKLKRREFLQKSALAVAGAAALASRVTIVAEAEQWTTGLKTLDVHQGETLLRMSRQVFPHSQLDDTYYVKVVQDLDGEAGTKPATAKLLRDGVARLDRSKGAKFVALSESDQIAVLKTIERSDF